MNPPRSVLFAKVPQLILLEKGHVGGGELYNRLYILLQEPPYERDRYRSVGMGGDHQPTGAHAFQQGQEGVEITVVVMVKIREPVEPDPPIPSRSWVVSYTHHLLLVNPAG